MREIKFKVWDKIESLMFDKVEYIGFSDKVVHLKTHNLCDDEELMNFNGNRWQDKYGGFNDIDFTEIELMQGTGLKDKNGVEIHEGNIIEITNNDSIKNYKVEYVLGCYGISTEKGFSILTDYATSLSDGTNSICKVIGNIYETPNLLRDM